MRCNPFPRAMRIFLLLVSLGGVVQAKDHRLFKPYEYVPYNGEGSGVIDPRRLVLPNLGQILGTKPGPNLPKTTNASLPQVVVRLPKSSPPCAHCK